MNKEQERPTQSKIQLINGSTIIARPVGATGNSIRGFEMTDKDNPKNKRLNLIKLKEIGIKCNSNLGLRGGR